MVERGSGLSDVAIRFQAAVNMDAALRMGLTVTPDDIDLKTFNDIRMLNNERTRYENEQQQQAARSKNP